MLAAGAACAAQPEVNPDRQVLHRPNPDQAGAYAPTTGGTASLSPITNHGGPVMAGQPNVHVIWYGNWNQTNGSDNPAGQQIIRDLISGLNGSNYLGISKSYTSTNGAVSGLLGTYNEGVDTGSQGTRLSDARVQSYITAAQTTSPNGNPGVDGMASVVAHELEETLSDPNANAWYDASGAENADKCYTDYANKLQ